MNLRLGAILVFTGLAIVLPAWAGEITSGPTDRISGPFNVQSHHRRTSQGRRERTNSATCASTAARPARPWC